MQGQQQTATGGHYPGRAPAQLACMHRMQGAALQMLARPGPVMGGSHAERTKNALMLTRQNCALTSKQQDLCNAEKDLLLEIFQNVYYSSEA